MTFLWCWLFACSIVIPHGDPTTYDAPEPYIGRPVPAHTIPNIIRGAASVWGVSAEDLERVAWCESRNDPSALNHESGASGLFQFMPATFIANARRAGLPYTERDIFDPAASAMTAAYMFSQHQESQWVCR